MYTQIRVLSTLTIEREAGGIANRPTRLSMTIPCSINVDVVCPATA
jgi:hypothetical protein